MQMAANQCAVCDNNGSEKVEGGPSSRLVRQAFAKKGTV